MLSFICLSLLALASPGEATPLSTSPYIAPRQRSPFVKAPLLHPAPLHDTINNSYIIMFKQDLSPALKSNHFNFLQTVHQSDPLLAPDSGIQHVYEHANGYAGKFTDNVIEDIRSMPEVDFVERDQIVRTMAVQKSAPWGLARISHRPRLTFGTFSKYLYEEQGGEGVDVYVVDTGINIKHVEFQGRASWGETFPRTEVNDDENGHGTHVAGTIASRKYGVAKAAHVIAVKVLGSNGSGSMSDVVGGIEWAATQAKAKEAAARAEYAATGKTKHKGSVGNMSLGGQKSESLDRAVNAAVASGLSFAVAAGNDNRDACAYSPAAAEKAVTVAASTLGDERAYFSNHGECCDVFAPGLNILSTYKGSSMATATLSGTSMASPHVAGLMAYLLSLYPSETFDPILKQDFLPSILESQPAFTVSYVAAIYRFVHASLPAFASEFLPSPRILQVFDPRLDEPPMLKPEQLKKALIALATEGVLTELPSKTPNLLVFNNATFRKERFGRTSACVA